MTLDEHFAGFDESRLLFNALLDRINEIVPTEPRVTKSQVAFYRKRPFAWAWIPEKHLGRKAAPLVVSLSFPQRDPSPRWKEIVEPAQGRFMHHLEIYTFDDIDDEVIQWLRSAWEFAS
jgi:hypothetical protein